MKIKISLNTPTATRFFTVQEVKKRADSAVERYLGRKPNSQHERDNVVQFLLSNGTNVAALTRKDTSLC